MLTLLLADDHPLFRNALRLAVGAVLPQTTFAEAQTVAGLLEMVEQQPLADALLLDLEMPGAHGFSALVAVRGLRPELPVMIVSATDDARTISDALAYGAQGFLSKSADAQTLVSGIQQLLEGERVVPAGYRPANAPATAGVDHAAADLIARLTPAQFRVLGMMLSGLANKQIAYELDVSEATVKAHVTAILRKFGVHSRTQAVLRVSAIVGPVAAAALADD